jgi:hypothetical protein
VVERLSRLKRRRNGFPGCDLTFNSDKIIQLKYINCNISALLTNLTLRIRYSHVINMELCSENYSATSTA